MGVVNPYSQPELEEKGWEFSSEGVPVKPDDGSVTMQSLDEELSTLAQVCQSLVKDGYVFAPNITYQTTLEPVGYNRFFIQRQYSADYQWISLIVYTIPAGTTTKTRSVYWDAPSTSIKWTGYNIRDGAIDTEQLGTGAVTQEKIDDGAVSLDKLDANVKKSITDATPKSVLLQQDLIAGTVYTKAQFESMTDASFNDFYKLQVGDYVRVTTGGGVDEERRIVIARYDQSDPMLHYIVVMSPINGLLTSYTFDGENLTVTSAIVAIGTDSIASGAVTGAKIASGAVTGAKIASGAVTQAKIGASAVVTDKIKNGAVTPEKLDDPTQTLLSTVMSLITNGYVYDPTIGYGKTPTDVPYGRMYIEYFSNGEWQDITIGHVLANDHIKYVDEHFNVPSNSVKGSTYNIADKAITLPKFSDDVQTTLNNVPKQYELTTTLENETDMTPAAFLAKYGLSVDVIKGLRVGDSLHVGGTGETYGVLSTYIEGDFAVFQLGHVVDESDVTYAATLAISSNLATVATYTLLRDNASQVLQAVTTTVNLPWGSTIQNDDIESVTKISSSDWRTKVQVGSIIADPLVVNKYWQVLRAADDILYLGLYNEPQTDGTAKQIQYSIRLRYNDNRTDLTSISFYADEVETGSSNEGAIRFDAAQELTPAQQEQVFANLGLKVVYINSSEFRTTLTEERANEIIQADICIATYNGHHYAFYFSGHVTTGLSYFTTLQSNENVLRFTVSDTFALSAIVIAKFVGGGSVRYDTAQTLTDAQKKTVQTNIGIETPYVPVEYTLPKDFPYNGTDSQRYVTSVIGMEAFQAELNEGDVFVYEDNRYKIIGKSVKTVGTDAMYSICFECATFNGGAMGQTGSTGYGGLFFTKNNDGCVVYTVQQSEATEGTVDIDWTSVSGGNVFVANEPVGSSLVAVPYNRAYIDMYVQGLDTPIFAINTIAAHGVDKVVRRSLSLANNIGTPCLRAKCVTAAKIADKAVTVDKLDDDVVVYKDLSLTVKVLPTAYYSTSEALVAATGLTFEDFNNIVTNRKPTRLIGTGGNVYVTGSMYNDIAYQQCLIDLGTVTTFPNSTKTVTNWFVRVDMNNDGTSVVGVLIGNTDIYPVGGSPK